VGVDSEQYPEDMTAPYYDSLLAGPVTHGGAREETMSRMQRAPARTANVVGAGRRGQGAAQFL
jgi:acetyl/propionyl-CoA carboxylase alpha subunit